MIYLDNAATSMPKPAAVTAAATNALTRMSSPGRGGHEYAMAAAETAYRCREKAAALFNVPDPEHVVFTHNATMGLNIAIHSTVKAGDRVLVSGYEHNAVMRPLEMIGADVVVCRSGLFQPEDALLAIEDRLTSGVKAVIVNHVSNVFGFVLPVDRIGALCRQRGIPFIVDASQSAGAVTVDFQSLNADFIAMPGHKGLYGPQGTGLLLCGDRAKPFIAGGTGSDSADRKMPDYLPDMLEAGTHNMVGIAGLEAGIDFVSRRGTDAILAHERELVRRTVRGLTGVAGVTVYTCPHLFCQTGVVSFNISGLQSERVGEELAKRGFAVRCGLHCAPEAHKSAGTFDTGTVRVSFGAFNTARDADRLVRAVKAIKNK